jgi:hypothetical protein
MFHRNVGGADRAIRLVLGLILLPTGLFLLATHQAHGSLITILGAAALVTGGSRFCLLYVPFSLSSARPRTSRVASKAT